MIDRLFTIALTQPFQRKSSNLRQGSETRSDLADSIYQTIPA